MRYFALVLVLAACGGPTPPAPPGGGKETVELGAECGNGGQSIGCAPLEDGGNSFVAICVDGGFVTIKYGLCSYSAAESQVTAGPGPVRWLFAVEGDSCVSGMPSCEIGPVGETWEWVAPQSVLACEDGGWVAKKRCPQNCFIDVDAGASCR